MCAARKKPIAPRWRCGLVAACALATLTDVGAAESDWSPSAAFFQWGTAGSTRGFTTGLTWDWSREWDLWGGRVGGYWELSVSRWSYPTRDGRRDAWLGQFGVTPTFRYRLAEGTSPWFVEAGVGASATTTLYETQRKRFSSSFNFATRIGVGRNFGESGQHELSLRAEHFSNAGIKRPNPGEDFAQLRYSYRFR